MTDDAIERRMRGNRYGAQIVLSILHSKTKSSIVYKVTTEFCLFGRKKSTQKGGIEVCTENDQSKSADREL